MTSFCSIEPESLTWDNQNSRRIPGEDRAPSKLGYDNPVMVPSLFTSLSKNDFLSRRKRIERSINGKSWPSEPESFIIDNLNSKRIQTEDCALSNSRYDKPVTAYKTKVIFLRKTRLKQTLVQKLDNTNFVVLSSSLDYLIFHFKFILVVLFSKCHIA